MQDVLSSMVSDRDELNTVLEGKRKEFASVKLDVTILKQQIEEIDSQIATVTNMIDRYNNRSEPLSKEWLEQLAEEEKDPKRKTCVICEDKKRARART